MRLYKCSAQQCCVTPKGYIYFPPLFFRIFILSYDENFFSIFSHKNTHARNSQMATNFVGATDTHTKPPMMHMGR